MLEFLTLLGVEDASVSFAKGAFVVAVGDKTYHATDAGHIEVQYP